MNEFLTRHKLPKLTQEEIDHLSSPVSIKEIEYLIVVLDTQKPLAPRGLTVDLYHPLKKESDASYTQVLHSTGGCAQSERTGQEGVGPRPHKCGCKSPYFVANLATQKGSPTS